jgi:acetolactate synthase-1/2/3 large subunit
MAPNVAQVLAAALADRGVRYAFGIPGGVLLPVMDAMGEAGIEFVLVRHESAAGFMADAVWQLTGTPGVCLATLGPGMTNLVSPVAGAMLERSRVLAITAQCRTEIREIYTHQTLDQVALLAPLVAWGGLLERDAPEAALGAALGALDRGRPAPVHLDVPGDLWGLPVGALGLSAPEAPRGADPAVLQEAAAAIRRARRPVLAVGIGDLSDAAAMALRRLSEVARIPVMTTYRAKGMVDETGPWSLGAFGLSQVMDAHQQARLSEADLLIAVGLDPVELRPQWLPGWPADLPMIGLDPYGQPDIQHHVQWDLRADVPSTLDGLVAACADGASTWTAEELRAHRAILAGPLEDGPDGPAATIRAVQQGAGPDALLSLDVGAHRITASHTWQCTRPRTVLQSNGLSSMGTGLPGAIAAKLCFPERPAIALTGDAGLWMSLGELGVVQDRGMDLVVVYLADEALSLIQLKQERIGLADRGVRFTNPDVCQLAGAFGGVGRKVRGAGAVQEAVAAAVAAGGLWVIEATIDPRSYRQQM